MYDVAPKKLHDFAAFRTLARSLACAGVSPQDVIWHDDAGDSLFATPELPAGESLQVPAGFFHLAEDVICHRDAAAPALLYELLWRLTHGERELLAVSADPLMHRLARMQKAIGRDIHKMHAFVRFRQVKLDQVEADAREHFVAWFEPQHFIVERAAPFFRDRFAAMRWSILTPVGCAYWDGVQLMIGEPLRRDDVPPSDDFEAWWRTYYRATFNPARANPRMMRAEMPKHYWRNLPEAPIIPALLAEAAERTEAMVAAAPTQPRKHARPFAAAAAAMLPTSDLASLAQEAAGCQRCSLFATATQTVLGAGPQNASLMLVGEQPGDQEDLAGQAFVGPAGQLLDRALKAAGIERSKVYVTNAVKHFKFTPRGKLRLHKRPERSEVEACSWWLKRELSLVRPALIVALGATAAQALLGRSVRILSERGTCAESPAGFKVMITVHPSFLLRLPNVDDKEREFAAFVRDLREARSSFETEIGAADT
jgi:probable DNA metabolism protein